MKIVRTAKIKLDDVSVSEVLPTLQAYSAAYNLACQAGFEQKTHSQVKIHHLSYQKIREMFKLPSQLACSAISKASESLKSVLDSKNKYPKCPISVKHTSFRLDNGRAYTLFLNKKQGNALLLDGRKKFTLDIPVYYQQYFSNGWEYGSADLVVRDGKVYLHISVSKDIPAPIPSATSVIKAVDRGLRNIAATSDNKFYKSSKIQHTISLYQRLRSALQKKGTKSAKRHLVRLREQEQRFRADINHQISKQILSGMKPGDILVLEELKNIRIRSKYFNKKMRRLLNSWSFFQLEQFLTYKATAMGIIVVKVNPAYTSQTCSECGCCEKKNRSGSDFCCTSCGFKLNADLNASRNIRNLNIFGYMPNMWAPVNEPIVGEQPTSGTLLTNNQQIN